MSTRVWIRPADADVSMESWHLTTADLERDGWKEITQSFSGFDIIDETYDEVQTLPPVDVSYTTSFTMTETDTRGWRKLFAMMTIYDPTVYARTPQHMPTLRHVAPHR